jgi:hypothetical protein
MARSDTARRSPPVPLPALTLAPIPARVSIQSVRETAPNGQKVERHNVVVDADDLKAGLQPGYPFYVPGIAGQRWPHPPMRYAPQFDANEDQVEIAGEKQRLDGGLPRNVVVAEPAAAYEKQNCWDFSKDSDVLFARELEEEEGDAVEKAAMKACQKRTIGASPRPALVAKSDSQAGAEILQGRSARSRRTGDYIDPLTIACRPDDHRS